MRVLYGGRSYKAELIEQSGKSYLWLTDIGVRIPVRPWQYKMAA